jgi:hypothetical protein
MLFTGTHLVVTGAFSQSTPLGTTGCMLTKDDSVGTANAYFVASFDVETLECTNAINPNPLSPAFGMDGLNAAAYKDEKFWMIADNLKESGTIAGLPYSFVGENPEYWLTVNYLVSMDPTTLEGIDLIWLDDYAFRGLVVTSSSLFVGGALVNDVDIPGEPFWSGESEFRDDVPIGYGIFKFDQPTIDV